MKNKIAKIKEHWNSEAEKHVDPMSTMLDKILNKMEIDNISKYIPKNKKVLDAGCGPGASLIQIARKLKNNTFVGCDYAEKTILRANELLAKESRQLQKRVSFKTGDVLHLPFPENSFDVVTTDRVLINLISLQQQIEAAREISRVLKKGGIYIGCESMHESSENLNGLRKSVGLEELKPRWHNLFIKEKGFINGVKRFFKVKAVDNFSSSYFIASRVFNAKLAALEGQEPKFDHHLNQIGSKLPSIGDFGLLKIIVLIKK